MPIIQIAIWKCELCGKKEVKREEVFPYSDKVVSPPSGKEWGYVEDEGEEKLICPECMEIIRQFNQFPTLNELLIEKFKKEKKV